jgi:hypothetical protein
MQVYELWNTNAGTFCYFNGKPSVEQIQELCEGLSDEEVRVIMDEGMLLDKSIGYIEVLLKPIILVDGKHKQEG